MTQNLDDEQLRELEPDDMIDDEYWYEVFLSYKEDEAVEARFET